METWERVRLQSSKAITHEDVLVPKLTGEQGRRSEFLARGGNTLRKRWASDGPKGMGSRSYLG